jgi:hypothetical protein
MEDFYHGFLSENSGVAMFLPFLLSLVIFGLSYWWLWKRSKPREKVMAAR